MLSKYKNYWLTIAAIIAVSLAWVFLYWGNFTTLWGRWNTEDSNYCMLIPLLFAYLVYHNKDFIWKQIGSAVRQISRELSLLSCNFFTL